MNGAQALLKAMEQLGVDTCFSNPGTSEMHFVAALDDVPGVRGILTLFEGVATGAADGYGRVTGRPAATLLHLGPGLGNGLANLHNARRAATPILNVVGDHATHHVALDAPLQSDIEAVAGSVSAWQRTSSAPDHLVPDVLEAVTAAMRAPGGVATLILPADVSWGELSATPEPLSPVARSAKAFDEVAVERAAAALRVAGAVLFVGGDAMSAAGLVALGRLQHHLGVRVVSETFPSIVERGAGRFTPERLGYLAEFARAQIGGTTKLVLAGTPAPVSFFAYPGQPGRIAPEGCEEVVLADRGEDVVAALEALADLLGAGPSPAPGSPAELPERPSGVLNAQSMAAAVAATLPEGAVVVDESNTSGLYLPSSTAGCPPHRWTTLSGGAIGYGMPVATGAAVGDPSARIVNLEADGSAMYTLQALWTQAREGLNVTTVVLANRSYAVLNMELDRVGATARGSQARAMLDLEPPVLDFVALAQGMGVPALRVETADELARALEAANRAAGPQLIEAVMPKGLG